MEPEVTNHKEPTKDRHSRKWLIWVLVILTVGIGAGVGGYYYEKGQADKDKTVLQKQVNDLKAAAAKKASASSAAATQATPNKSNELVITQWGVKLTLPSGLSDLGYAVKNVGGVEIAYFSTKTLVGLDPNCSTDNAGIGAISRETSLRDASDPYAGEAMKHIGNYYYYYGHPQAYCSDNAAAQKEDIAQMAEMETTFSTLASK
jgi:hypothetical protein